MLNFIFGRDRKGKAEPRVETQRETATRALDELNGVLAGLDPKPRVGFDPATGAIDVTWPDQMPDEALALPAPKAPGADDALDGAADTKKAAA